MHDAIKARGVQVHGLVYDVGSGYVRLQDVPHDKDAVAHGVGVV